MLQRYNDIGFYYHFMHSVPWNPEAEKVVEKYAWRLVYRHERYKDSKKPEYGIRHMLGKDMTDAEIAEGEKRAALYIEKYIKNKEPVCDPNSF